MVVGRRVQSTFVALAVAMVCGSLTCSASETANDSCDGVIGSDEGKPATRYDEEVTRPVGEASQILLDLPGGQRIFGVFSNVEPEVRIRIPAVSGSQRNHVTTILEDYGPDFERWVRNQLGPLERERETWQGRVRAAPLASKFDHFHESDTFSLFSDSSRRLNRSWRVGEVDASELVQVIVGRRLDLKSYQSEMRGGRRSNRSSDYVVPSYFIGWNKETAIYYDTDDGLLEKRAIAVRFKVWTPKDGAPGQVHKMIEDGELAGAVQRMVTIKRHRGEEHGFTLRQEAQSQWPKDLSLAHVADLAKEILVRQFGLRHDEVASLAPRRRVNNVRLAIKLIDSTRTRTDGRTPLQIGFVTIDHFHNYDLVSGRSLTPHGEAQFEVELFPAHFAELNNDKGLKEGVNAFLHALKTRFNGEIISTPKYLIGK